jgi:O-antigen ligase
MNSGQLRLDKLSIYLVTLIFPFVGIKILSVIMIFAFLIWGTRQIFIEGKFRLGTLDIALMLFFIANLISASFAFDPFSSFKQLIVLAAYIGLYFIVSKDFNQVELRILLYVMAISAVLPILIGYYQLLFASSNQDLWIDRNINPDLEQRLYSVFENPNIFGEYLVNIFFVVVGLLISNKNKWGKAILALFALVVSHQVILTYSRGAWITYFIGIGVFLLLYNWKWIVTLIPLGILGLIIAPNSVKQRLMSIVYSFKDSSFFYRIEIWKNAIEMTKIYGIKGLGYGYQSFHEYYAHYKIPGFNATHSHNLFLQIILESGIIGLILWLYIVISTLFYNVLRIFKYSLSLKYKEWISLAILLAIMVHGMIDYTLFDYRINIQFWLAIALTAQGMKTNKENTGETV